MDARLRISVAAGVMLAGLLGAFAFRHPAATDRPLPTSAASLNLQRQVASAIVPVATESRERYFAPAPPLGPVVKEPTRSADPQSKSGAGNVATELEKTYSGPSLQDSPRWDRVNNVPPPGVKAVQAVKHRIVDGDSLESLADRYLGSPARAKDIFDANRDVLSDPGLLPIGADLKIPPTEQPAKL